MKNETKKSSKQSGKNRFIFTSYTYATCQVHIMFNQKTIRNFDDSKERVNKREFCSCFHRSLVYCFFLPIFKTVRHQATDYQPKKRWDGRKLFRLFILVGDNHMYELIDQWLLIFSLFFPGRHFRYTSLIVSLFFLGTYIAT